MENQGPTRINKYDNLKGLAIFLIVLGHILVLNDLESANFIHRFISIIDLPIFFFVSGYFSKIEPDGSIKAFKRLFVPYIIFSLIYAICMIIINVKIQILFIYTSFAMWFLIALFAMKLSLPIIDKFKYPILTSFLLALIIGFININPDLLGITRFFAFLPIFLIGFYYNDYKLRLMNKYKKLEKNKSKIYIIGVIIFICCIVIAYVFPTKIIVLAEAYDYPIDMIKRSIILILGIFATIILNEIITNKKNILTKIGKNSYAIYLFHIYFISLINLSSLHNSIPTNEYLFLIFAIATTTILVLILSCDIFTKLLNKIVNTANSILFK